MRGYVERGFFRSATQLQRRGHITTFSVVWHHRRTFRLVIDTHAQTVAFPDLLPGVPARSAMMKELRACMSDHFSFPSRHQRSGTATVH